MSSILRDYFVSDWGMWRCPPDLVELSKVSPKITIGDEKSGFRRVPDPSTKQGKAYYKLEQQLLDAIGVICSSGTMDIVNVKTREEIDEENIRAAIKSRKVA